MADFTIKEVLLEEGVSDYRLTRQILKRLPGIRVQSKKGLLSSRSGSLFDMGKDRLHLISYKGEFLKPCPGTKEYICCGYQILNVGTNCPLDCSYCILQSYFNEPNLRIHVNLEEEIESVLQFIDSKPKRIFRVGTGEFTDSLAVDPITCWSDILLPSFSVRKNAILELKTKTTHIERVLQSNHRDRIIMSWSLNSPFIASREEHKAASLEKRLKAARRCQSDGFVLGFHFDPLIPHPQWEQDYMRTIDLLDKYIDPKGIIWISMGSFRYMPALKQIIRRRHPKTHVLDGEFITGLDGKMRYFKPIRIKLYGFMRENLAQWHPHLGLYLCMESHDVWEKSMGWSPGSSAGLRAYLDSRVVEFFG